MHRFFVEERIAGVGHITTLSREESLHAARALRLRAGEQVCLLDGESLYAGKLTEVSEQASRAVVTALLPSPEPTVQVTIFQGLPKADKLELIVQKATELGVWEIAPMEMERSVAKAEKADRQAKKRERLQRIALEAAKQSGRAHVPMVCEAASFAEVCARLGERDMREEAKPPSYDAVFVAWEEERALPLSQAVSRLNASGGPTLGRIALVIGPEGGISAGECARLKALGAASVTLGRRVLRTETAGLCALSVIWAALGEM